MLKGLSRTRGPQVGGSSIVLFKGAFYIISHVSTGANCGIHAMHVLVTVCTLVRYSHAPKL